MQEAFADEYTILKAKLHEMSTEVCKGDAVHISSIMQVQLILGTRMVVIRKLLSFVYENSMQCNYW